MPPPAVRTAFQALLVWLGLLAIGAGQAFTESGLPPLGVNLGGVTYYTTPYFADAASQAGGWLEYATTEFGTAVPTFGSPQFDANGCPKYLNAGKKLRLILYGLNANYFNRPATWPLRDELANGKIVLVWTGDADIRLNNATFLAAESSGASTGRLVNGRRVYRKVAASGMWLNVEDINAANPITKIKAWLPDPADPQNATLEGKLFHPTFLARLTEGNWAFLRMMGWASTNADPEVDWSDRRLPTYLMQTGILNPRSPATGFAGNRITGVAFEHMVAACNAANRDLWINVPNLATDDFITRLAQTIRFGSDGVNPYSSAQASPVYAPLNAGLRVYVEYSNEIWSSGNSFPQGNWAQEQATAAGLTKAQFNARRFCEVWRSFQNVFGGNTRLVKVAAIFTASPTYTTDFLNELKAYGPTLSPPQEPDLISPTTYFGNGIQDWAFQKATDQAGASDPWFLTTATFDAGGGVIRPVSVAANDGYWTGSAVLGHLDQTFQEWKRLLLSGSTQTGAGPDANGIGGGFDIWLRTLAQTTFAARKPLVTYEGGPSIYTDSRDGGDNRDDGITTFMEMLNRQPQMAAVYRIHLNQAMAKGLRTHGVFTEAGGWGKYGEWGHLETITQPTAAAPKWQFLLSWAAEMAGLRHIDDVQGAAPQFATAAKLPTAVFGQPYSATITTSGGEGARALANIGHVLDSGLSLSLTGDQAGLSGTPAVPGDNYIYLRVRDADNDPAWRTFYFKTVGGPHTLLQSNFEGTNSAQNRPWTPFYAKKAGLIYTGWNKGAGITASNGDDALVYYQNMPASEASSTLAAALTANQYWTASIQAPAGESLNLRNAEVRFTIQRIDFHAPRQYAAFTSIGGFAAGNEVFTTPRFASTVDNEYIFKLPDTAAYEGLTAPIEFRLVGFSGQFNSHKVAIRGFKIVPVNTPPVAGAGSAGATTGDTAMVTLPFATTDADGDPVSVQAISASNGAPFTLGAVSGNSVAVTGAAGAVGAGTISFTVADGFGGTANGSASVNVTDNDPPVFSNVPINVLVAPASESGTVVSYAPPTVSDNLAVTSSSASHPSGTTFPSGTTTVTFTAGDAANNVGAASFDVTVAPLTPLQSWRAQYFGNGANAGNAADLFDYDRDGLLNLVEYAFGLNPKQPASLQLPPLQRIGPNLELSFPQPANVSGITYLGEWRPDLTAGNWLSVPDTGTGNFHKFSVPIGTDPQLFLRLKITNP